MACLLLYAFDCTDNFWQLYGDFLPSSDECTSFLLATEVGIYVTNLEDPFATLSFNSNLTRQICLVKIKFCN